MRFLFDSFYFPQSDSLYLKVT